MNFAREERLSNYRASTMKQAFKQSNKRRPSAPPATSDNNTFLTLRSAVRFALLRCCRSPRRSRNVMDTNPWTYRVMAENYYEGRIRDTCRHQYAHPPRIIAWSCIQTREGLRRMSMSTTGKTLLRIWWRLRIDRRLFRTAVRLDSPEALVSSVVIRCHPPNGSRGTAMPEVKLKACCT